MKRSKFSDEQILAIVREGEAGRKVADLCRTHGITEQTYYRWKAKYGGMELSEMQRLKQVEDENLCSAKIRRRAHASHAAWRVTRYSWCSPPEWASQSPLCLREGDGRRT